LTARLADIASVSHTTVIQPRARSSTRMAMKYWTSSVRKLRRAECRSHYDGKSRSFYLVPLGTNRAHLQVRLGYGDIRGFRRALFQKQKDNRPARVAVRNIGTSLPTMALSMDSGLRWCVVSLTTIMPPRCVENSRATPFRAAACAKDGANRFTHLYAAS